MTLSAPQISLQATVSVQTIGITRTWLFAGPRRVLPGRSPVPSHTDAHGRW